MLRREQASDNQEDIILNLQNFQDLKEHGLRVTSGIDTRGKRLKIRFEAPAQINNAPLFLYSPLTIGMYSYARTGTLRYLDEIGRYCSIGPGVTIGEGEHPTRWLSTSPSQYTLDQFAFYPPEAELAKARKIARTDENNDGATGFTTIGNDVWIGGGATIRRGVKIGDGAIIGGNAFVTRDVEPYSIVAGLPAKKVRMRFPEEIIRRLTALAWWRFDINDLKGVPFDRIEAAIDRIAEMEARGDISERPRSYREVTVGTKGYSDLV